MFFIDDDEAELRQGREDGGSRANHNAGFSCPDAVPFIKTLALGEVRVEDGDLVV